MEILVKIANESNCSLIIDELSLYVFNRKDSIAKAAIQSIGQIWSNTGLVKRNILVSLIKKKTLLSKSLNEEIIISICNFIQNLKTEERIKSEAHLIALMTTFFIELEDKRAQEILLNQFFKFVVCRFSPVTASLYDD